ncbi:MAG: hypothetical protein IKT52_04625 [Oscillospiraceae bacterium]|nr:hypothetical protein [Oscillospiraceae bacterium]
MLAELFMGFKLMFIAPCSVDNVGAATRRPAVQCCELALYFGEFVTDNRSGRVAERSELK